MKELESEKDKKGPIKELPKIIRGIEEQIAEINLCQKKIEALGIGGFEEEFSSIVRKFDASSIAGIASALHSLKEKIEKRREKEYKEIEKVFAEAKILIRRATSVCKKPEILAGLMLLGVELYEFFQKFSQGSIDYQEAKVAMLNCLEQSKILSSATPLKEEDYYEILGVSPEATQEEIKEVYHQKLKEYHPDKQAPGSKQWVIKEAEQMTQKIIKAYEVLGNPTRKKEYDGEFSEEVERE